MTLRLLIALGASATFWLSGGWGSAAQGPVAMVRVVVARTDVRTEANESSSAIGAVRYGEVLPLLEASTGWDHVTVFVGTSRVDGFVVAESVAPAPSGAAVSAALDIGSTYRVPGHTAGAGVSVALDAGGKTMWIRAVPTRAVPVAVDLSTSLGALGKSPAMDAAVAGATVMPADVSAEVTWAWILAERDVVASTSSANPTITAIYNDVPDLPASQYLPVLLQLPPAGSEWRVIAAARGRADQPFRSAEDWTIKPSLVQSAVGGLGYSGGNGLMKIRLARALEPGDYAIAFRPIAPKAVAGDQVFAGAGLAAAPSITYGEVWPFRVS